MLGFLFTLDDAVALEPEALEALRDGAPAVLDAAVLVLEALPADSFAAAPLQEALSAVLVSEMAIKPRFAFSPLRTAITGRRVSPPLFESMEILGKAASLARLRRLRAQL